MAIMTAEQLANKCREVAQNYKTAYVWGTFGLVANASNMQRMINQYSTNTQYLPKAKTLYGSGFYFDCVGLIKAILWGWKGDRTKTYGGAVYASNGVPDVSADGMIAKCKDVSTDFSKLEVGEALWLKGHIGVYIGNGFAVEATPAFNNGVQITAVRNIGTKSGYSSRTWTKHGKIPYVSYSGATTKTETTKTTVEGAASFNKSLAGNYTTTAALNMRAGAGTSKAIITTIPKGKTVTNYGYYTTVDGVKWLYVTYGNTTGFCSAKYLKK